MNVLFVSAEVDPFAKVGGLADVVGSLPKALRERGSRCARADALLRLHRPGALQHPAPVLVPVRAPHRAGTRRNLTGRNTTACRSISCARCPTSGRSAPSTAIGTATCRASSSSVRRRWKPPTPLRDQLGWFPDVFHVNDWHTGLIPFLIDLRRAYDRAWRGVGSMLTIHNMAYQGDHIGKFAWDLGIPGRNHPDLQRLDLGDNMLAMAIAYSRHHHDRQPALRRRNPVPVSGLRAA